jgi:hypothetical protein
VREMELLKLPCALARRRRRINTSARAQRTAN